MSSNINWKNNSSFNSSFSNNSWDSFTSTFDSLTDDDLEIYNKNLEYGLNLFKNTDITENAIKISALYITLNMVIMLLLAYSWQHIH